jgi:hypothetical protein
MSNLARHSLIVHSLTDLIPVKDCHLRRASGNVHYSERKAERPREQCPLCNTVPLITGHQDKEVYETCHGIGNENQGRSKARGFFCLYKRTRDLSNRLTKFYRLGRCTDEDFSSLGCDAFQVVGLCVPPFRRNLQFLHCSYLESFAKHFATLSSFVENWRTTTNMLDFM